MKKIKLLLVFTILITMLPMKIHASEESLYDQIQMIVENKVKQYASKINQTNADDNAAIALAKHGINNRTTLKVNDSHALTATLMNSNLGQKAIIDGVTESVMTALYLGKESVFVDWDMNWGSSEKMYYFKVYSNNKMEADDRLFARQTVRLEKDILNEYDNSLVWIVGSADADMNIKRIKTTDNTITFEVKIQIMDRFDFSNASNSVASSLLNGIANLLFREFDWESTASFTVEVPNYCNHTTNNYHLEFNSKTNLLNSINETGFIENISKMNEYYKQDGTLQHYYMLDKSINLKHDKPWVLSYTIKNQIGGVMLSATDNRTYEYMNLLHQSNSFLYFQRHKFENEYITESYGLRFHDYFSYKTYYTYTLTLKNIIDDKGNNIIYLDVYNEDLGEYVLQNEPMDNYYSLSDSYILQDDNSKVLNEKDYIINFIGTSIYRLDADVFELKVWENGLNDSVDTFIDKITKQPTCLDKGSMTRACERCGYSYTTSIKALGHSFSNYVDNGNGTSTSICDHCNETDTRIDILLGDVNSDGTVTALDRTILARYLAQWSGYDTINEINADVNGDGKVTALDRTILARHLARWQGYEQLPYIK